MGFGLNSHVSSCFEPVALKKTHAKQAPNGSFEARAKLKSSRPQAMPRSQQRNKVPSVTLGRRRKKQGL